MDELFAFFGWGLVIALGGTVLFVIASILFSLIALAFTVLLPIAIVFGVLSIFGALTGPQ